MTAVAVARQRRSWAQGRRTAASTCRSLGFLAPGSDLASGHSRVAGHRHDAGTASSTGRQQRPSGSQTTSPCSRPLTLLIAFRNNVIWVLVFPFVVTVIGLVFAVLSERVRWATAFKIVIFLPMVFSVTASSLVFTQIFQLDPHIGVFNAIVQTVDDWYNPPGPTHCPAGQTRYIARHLRAWSRSSRDIANHKRRLRPAEHYEWD